MHGDYEDYLYDLGEFDHVLKPPYPRPGFVAETVYAEEWAALMLALDRDGINAEQHARWHPRSTARSDHTATRFRLCVGYVLAWGPPG